MTKVVSFDNPRLYPIVMVTLVILELSACGALLACYARQHGATGWYGLVIALIPGYWHSVRDAAGTDCDRILSWRRVAAPAPTLVGGRCDIRLLLARQRNIGGLRAGAGRGDLFVRPPA